MRSGLGLVGETSCSTNGRFAVRVAHTRSFVRVLRQGFSRFAGPRTLPFSFIHSSYLAGANE